jgi:hypothetical protein
LGNEGLRITINLLRVLPNLKEFAGDGFRPTPLAPDELHAEKNQRPPVLVVWEYVQKNIEKSDFPHQDFATAQIDVAALSKKDQRWISVLSQRQCPQTQKDRIAVRAATPPVDTRARSDESESGGDASQSDSDA